jgi:hypothetical protein
MIRKEIFIQLVVQNMSSREIMTLTTRRENIHSFGIPRRQVHYHMVQNFGRALCFCFLTVRDQIMVFWPVMPCKCPDSSQPFGGNCCLHFNVEVCFLSCRCGTFVPICQATGDLSQKTQSKVLIFGIIYYMTFFKHRSHLTA